MKHDIKYATAYYTGGGIYIYRGQLKNGLYFSTDDTWESIALCDSDTDTEEAEYIEFYENHMITEIMDPDYTPLFNTIIHWILEHNPDGNYLSSELCDRLKPER